MTVSIYSYQIKLQSKQKHLFPCHDSSNKFEEVSINDII